MARYALVKLAHRLSYWIAQEYLERHLRRYPDTRVIGWSNNPGPNEVTKVFE
jgi:hypothetical protein